MEENLFSNILYEQLRGGRGVRKRRGGQRSPTLRAMGTQTAKYLNETHITHHNGRAVASQEVKNGSESRSCFLDHKIERDAEESKVGYYPTPAYY